MDAMIDRRIAGEGTPEHRWQDWFIDHGLPQTDTATLLQDSTVVHIVSPHPDDEILACGGLIGTLADMNVAVHVLAVTDGEASHPGSTRWPGKGLASARTQESEAALSEVSMHVKRQRLGLPDGSVTAHECLLVEKLLPYLERGDLLIAPWRFDGHPDHEATGRASHAAAILRGCRFVEVPIWGWHWADPAAGQFPWNRAVALPLAEKQIKAKMSAIQKFRTQLEPDPCTGNKAVLPAFALKRLQRTFEVLFL